MSKCAELLQSKTEIDFIDVNVGCPIDLVFNKVKDNLHVRSLHDCTKAYPIIVHG